MQWNIFLGRLPIRRFFFFLLSYANEQKKISSETRILRRRFRCTIPACKQINSKIVFFLLYKSPCTVKNIIYCVVSAVAAAKTSVYNITVGLQKKKNNNKKTKHENFKSQRQKVNGFFFFLTRTSLCSASLAISTSSSGNPPLPFSRANSA